MFPFLANLDITLMVAKDNLGIKLNQASTAIRHKAYETLPSIDIKKPNKKKKTQVTSVENKPKVETDKKVETPKSETSPKTSSEPKQEKVEFEIPTPEFETTINSDEVVVEIIAPEEPNPTPEVTFGDGETMDYSNLVVDIPENEEELVIETTPPEPIIAEEEKTSYPQEDETETPPVYKRVPTQKDLDAVFSKWKDGDNDKNKKKKGKGGA